MIQRQGIQLAFSVIQTTKRQYQACALRRCLCYRDKRYSQLFNTDSSPNSTVSSVRIAEMSMLFYFYFISFAKKNKQTNRNNVGKDTATAVANYSGPVIVKGSTASSLIWTPKGQQQVCALQRCLGNTVSSLIRTPKGEQQVCAFQRCLCYRYKKYMYLFNTYSDRNRGRGYRGRGCRIFGTNRLSAVEGFSCYRGINCIGFSILETNRTVGNREDQY